MNVKLSESGAPAPELLWTELAPGRHMVQFCHHDAGVCDSLEAFVAGGLLLGESVVVLVTASHLGELRRRLRLRGMDPADLQIYGRLVALDAQELADRLVRDGVLDEPGFEAIVHAALQRARPGARVRAFGELVQLLWERGEVAAMLALEAHWQRICDAHGVALLCAYRKEGFGEGSEAGIRSICEAHATVIA